MLYSTSKRPKTNMAGRKTDERKRCKIENIEIATTMDDQCDKSQNTLAETSDTFVCGVCDNAMHFRTQYREDEIRCSICDQFCRMTPLVCDDCGLLICGNDANGYKVRSQEWESRCSEAHFDPIDTVREKLYNQQRLISQFSTADQLGWLQCMRDDIVQNSYKFRAELLHVSQIRMTIASKAELIIENLGLDATKQLVRLLVIFRSKLDIDIMKWFSSLIQQEPASLGVVALEACMRLKTSLENVKWLKLEMKLDFSNFLLPELVRITVEMGKLDVLDWLLDELKVDPSEHNDFAIREASSRGNLSAVERLLQDDRVSPLAVDNHAVRSASENGHLDVVERLLQDDQVDPAASNNYPIRWASQNGHLNVVERLLRDDRVDPSADDNYAIRFASQNGHFEVAERLLQDDRVNPSAEDNYAIEVASQRGHLNVVERLLQDDRVDPSAANNYAICAASKNGHSEVVERLLQDDRVNPSAEDNYAVGHASKNGHFEVVERLLQDDRVDPSAGDNYAIRFASQIGHLNVVERLLRDDRVEPSAKDNYAVKEASENGHLDVVEQLLQYDAVNPSAEDNYAIEGASERGHLNVVERLLQDDRVDPSAANNYAICTASNNGHSEVVERLLQDDRVDPSAYDNYAIRFASQNGHFEVVERLLQEDRVDPSARGCEAIRAARDENVVKLLYDRTSKIACYQTDNNQLMEKLSPLHHGTLIMGGLCLHSFRSDTLNMPMFLPPDVIYTILTKWAALTQTDDKQAFSF